MWALRELHATFRGRVRFTLIAGLVTVRALAIEDAQGEVCFDRWPRDGMRPEGGR